MERTLAVRNSFQNRAAVFYTWKNGRAFVNRFENWFCASSFWRSMTRKHLLSWMLSGTELGEHVLEIGAGPGAATDELRKRADRVTSLEYSHAFALGTARRSAGTNGTVVQGDA